MTSLTVISILFSLGLGVLIVAIIYKPPQWLIRYFQRRHPDVLFHVSTARKIVALTTDDGPSAHTTEINHILTTHDAKATFFVIGSNIPGSENTLKKLIEDGHELGNHAMHDEPSIKLSSMGLREQIVKVDQRIADLYTSVNKDHQAQPKYFRPGSGFFNSIIRQITNSLGYKVVLGSVYPWDAQISWPRLNAWHILSSVRPGSVIVIHERRATPEVLRIILPELQRRGFQIVTVTELLQQAEKQSRCGTLQVWAGKT